MSLNVPIAQQLPQIQEGISNAATNVSASIGNAAASISNIRNSLSTTVQDFSSKSLVDSSGEFLQTNTLIAKFVFLIIVLIAFMILMNLGIYLLSYFFMPSKSPYIIKGIREGTRQKRISQDPSQPGSITLYRSNNQATGMEYTWTVWLNIEPFTDTDTDTDFKHVFSKGIDATAIQQQIPIPTPQQTNIGQMPVGNNAPGVYLQKTPSGNNSTCTLTVIMDTVSGTAETVTIEDVPFQKWINVAIRLENKILDIYVNGTLKKRVAFQNVPKQNYGDIWVSRNGGFAGKLSDLRYFDRALNVFQLTNITMSGPNMIATPDIVDTSTDYLSGKWY
jgi:hypothetical protein